MIYKKICDVRPGDVIMYHDTVAIIVSKETVSGYSYYQYKCTLSQINSFSVEVKFYAPYDGYAIINCLDI